MAEGGRRSPLSQGDRTLLICTDHYRLHCPICHVHNPPSESLHSSLRIAGALASALHSRLDSVPGPERVVDSVLPASPRSPPHTSTTRRAHSWAQSDPPSILYNNLVSDRAAGAQVEVMAQGDNYSHYPPLSPLSVTHNSRFTVNLTAGGDSQEQHRSASTSNSTRYVCRLLTI